MSFISDVIYREYFRHLQRMIFDFQWSFKRICEQNNPHSMF